MAVRVLDLNLHGLIFAVLKIGEIDGNKTIRRRCASGYFCKGIGLFTEIFVEMMEIWGWETAGILIESGS